MLLTPHTIGGLATFVQLCFTICKDKPYIVLRVLRLNCKVFSSVRRNEPALGLNYNTIAKNKVRCVGLYLRIYPLDL